MSANENKALSRRVNDDVWNAKNVDAVDELYAAEYTLNGEPTTAEAQKEMLRALFAESPDLQVTIEDILAEGDRVAVRWTMRGMNDLAGEQQGYRGSTFYRIVDQQIVEDWYTNSPIDA